ERERIFRSGRLKIHAKECANRVELVGKRDRDRSWLARRAVMIADGVSDQLGFTLRFSKIAADDALEFRELADHPADQVCLGQPRGSLDLVRVGLHDALL